VRIYCVLLVLSGILLVLLGTVCARRAAQRNEEGMTVSAPAGLWVVAVIAGILCAMAVPLIFGLR
jgi:uncharacterized membrane protein